jgi:tetratricopeptide (TPR) repeat protein
LSGPRAFAADAVRADADAGPTVDAPDAAEERAMTPAARALYETGLARYAAKDYGAAIRAFEDGFALDPQREFLFANAQARRLAGDCRGAVPLYQRFLGMSPPAVQGSATQIALARCAQQMATAKLEPVVRAPVAPPPAPPPPWTHDRAGAALLVAGVVGLGVGSGFLAAALAARPPANASSYDAYDSAGGRAETRRSIAVVGFAAGGALVAAGVARYAFVRHERKLHATLTIVPGGLALGGAF